MTREHIYQVEARERDIRALAEMDTSDKPENDQLDYSGYLLHAQDAREALEAYCGDFIQDFDLEKAFGLLYSYTDECHDYVEPTGADIIDVLQSCDISGRC